MLTSCHEQHQPGAHKQPTAGVLLLRVLWNSFRIDAARQLSQTHGRHFNTEPRRQRNLWLLGGQYLQQFFFLAFVFAAGRPAASLVVIVINAAAAAGVLTSSSESSTF
jgi:hypothetical protein